MNWQRLGGGLAISLIIGLLAGGYVFSQFKKMAQAKTIPTVQVVVSSRAIPLGTRLQPSDLRVVTWPAAQPVEGMFTRVEDCVNRAVLASLVENEPLLEGKLAPRQGGAGLSATIPDGMRAVSVSVNDVIGVAGFVVPGTMVDVLVTGSTNPGVQNTNVTRTILENVRVMAAGQKVEQDREGKPQTVPVITLLVSPEDANSLTMASTQGRIQLALRNTLDTKKVDPPPVLQAALFGGGSAPPPPSEPKKGHTAVIPSRTAPTAAESFNVEVIRGDKKEVSKFPTPAGTPAAASTPATAAAPTN
jgi:pilus assembly protein CpaB